jgi:hypothetical protein
MATQTPWAERSGNGFRFNDLFATIVARGANVVAQVNFAGGGLNGRGRVR